MGVYLSVGISSAGLACLPSDGPTLCEQYIEDEVDGPDVMQIDHYGEVLVGCIDCNRWGHPGDDKLVMELLPDDLEALRPRRLGEPNISLLAVDEQERILLPETLT